MFGNKENEIKEYLIQEGYEIKEYLRKMEIGTILKYILLVWNTFSKSKRWSIWF
ncbi:hypothetical protein [Bacillus cereus]|uniref:hypothetical protein n=1 Tax=Bacillus cereus TaxID=1396 RepID=UPI001F60D858|nr:hypothetical protein [Bacillus cereus]